MTRLRITFLVLAACLLSVAAQAQERPPNIVLIVADDLGYNDISLHGNTKVRTPRIDSIGNDGVRFTRAHTTCATCSPSRAGLLTGRYQQRFGFEYLLLPPLITRAFDGSIVPDPGNRIVDIPPAERVADSRRGIPSSEITIAETLKATGYRTSAVGKWHVGSGPGLRPGDQGFDEFVGFYQVSSLYAPKDDPQVVAAKLPWSGVDELQWRFLTNRLVRDGKPLVPDEYLTTYFAKQGSRFIEENREHPFFLYLAFNAPHAPLQAPKENYDRLTHIEDHKTRVYYAMIESMDEAVGMILDKLDMTGLAHDTLVIFTSDNGATPYARIPSCNVPFRGGKYTNYQGGVVVPLLMRWPKGIERETVRDVPVSLLDILPTAAAAASAALPPDRPLDGVDLLPTIGDAAADAPHDVLVWRSGRSQAIWHGDYRLHVDETQDKVTLYQISGDVGEQHDLAERMPEKVAELKKLLDGAKSQFIAPAWPTPVYSRVPIDIRAGPPAADAEFVFFPL